MKNSSVRRLFVVVALGLCLLGAGVARADDGTYDRYGASIYPIQETDVCLDRECLTLEPLDDELYETWTDAIRVDALFVLRNTGEPKTVIIGFPEESAVGFPEESTIDNGTEGPVPVLLYFTVTVDGTPVKTVRQQLTTRKKDYAFDRVRLWRVFFDRGQTRSIRMSYLFSSNRKEDGGRIARYVLRTGALWADPIRRTDIVVRFRDPVKWMRFVPYPDERSEFHEVNWEPDRDIELAFNTKDEIAIWKACRPEFRFEDFGPEEYERYTSAVSSRRSLIRSYIGSLKSEELSPRSHEEIQSYINGYYATYGRPFTSKEWRQFFDRKWWYKADPKYTDARLTAADQKVIARLSGYLETALETKP